MITHCGALKKYQCPNPRYGVALRYPLSFLEQNGVRLPVCRSGIVCQAADERMCDTRVVKTRRVKCPESRLRGSPLSGLYKTRDKSEHPCLLATTVFQHCAVLSRSDIERAFINNLFHHEESSGLTHTSECEQT